MTVDPALSQASAVGAIVSNGHGIRSVALSAVDAAVPRYPGHTVGDLLNHLIVIYRWVTEIVETRARERLKQRPVDSSSWTGDETIHNFDAALDSLLSQIAKADPATEVWSFSLDHTVGFWQRRMAHETAMHRWDADSAVEAEPNPIPVPVAASGLAEGLRIHVQRPLRRVEIAGHGELVLLTCADASYSSTIRLLETGIEVHDLTGDHDTPDATVSGSASRLWLMMTGRVPFDTVDRSGDQQALDTLKRALRQIPPAI